MSKHERQKWWRNLTPEQQAAYVKKKQAKIAEIRKSQPPRVLRRNSEYPWMTEGVNSKNKQRWLLMIYKKNPWLKIA